MTIHRRGAITIAIATVLASPAATSAQMAPPKADTVLAVVATGSVTAVPDVATITVGVTVSRATSAAAGAANAVQATRLVDALRTAGIPDAAMRTTGVSLRPEHARDKDGDGSGMITGYRASNRLTVRLVDIGRTSAVIDALIAAGATDLDGPVFSFADQAPLLARARMAAVKNAGRQAADYAAALDLAITRVVRVSERSASDQNEGSNDIIVTANRAAAPVKPGEQKVQVTVWIDYALARR